ncbi:hypothetical protein GE21DRAFT_1076254 [Neurospora crassa]|nr:hypothetical protein GE21DRAFT_1076254 [Neurospora crassa]
MDVPTIGGAYSLALRQRERALDFFCFFPAIGAPTSSAFAVTPNPIVYVLFAVLRRLLFLVSISDTESSGHT